MGKDPQAFFNALVTGELIPCYVKAIGKYISRGQATPRIYKEQFDQIVKRLHRLHRRDIRILGYDSIAKFAEQLYEVFEAELDRILQSIEGEVDMYAFFEHQEKWMIKQQCGKEDHDLLWRSNIERYGHCLVKSAEWEKRVSEAVDYMMRNGSTSQRHSCGEIQRRLPGLAYEDLMSRTGPSHPRRDGEPRRLRHVLAPRHLCDRLRKDDVGSSRIRVEGENGEERRSKIIHSQDPQTLEALADADGDAVGTQFDCLLTEAAALANLSEEEGNLFRMHVDGYTQEDIALRKELSQATVSRRLKSIKGRIKKNIGKINIY